MRHLAPPEAGRLLRVLLVWDGPLSAGSGKRRARLPPMTREPTDAFEVFPFRYRDARTGKWTRARYKASREDIAARYTEWEITGPGEMRRPLGGYFNPGRQRGDR